MIKKSIVPFGSDEPAPEAERWLDLNSLAELELTSEDPEYPIDSALVTGELSEGWRAGNPGEQMIRICFFQPQTLHRIHLVFRELQSSRTHEFVIRWLSGEPGSTYREIVRQQYTFSPPNTTEEDEEYRVNLEGVKTVEIVFTPDITGVESYASLRALRVA